MDLSSSPTKTLTSWWKTFKQREESLTEHLRPSLPHMSQSSSAVPQDTKRPLPPTVVTNQGRQVTVPAAYVRSPIFGAPLDVSIRYASVRISLADRSGRSFVYGYVPVIVAKCSVYLKDNAQDVAGIFRISGSVRRIKLLQDTFNSPPRFGKDIDWQGFSVHDAATVLRRYLNNLPEPIVPINYYAKFRDVLRETPEVLDYIDAKAAMLSPGAHAAATSPGIADEAGSASFDAVDMPAEPSPKATAKVLKAYEELIFRLPPVNLQLLVYLLDLLSVFLAESGVNLMTAFNLAAVFQPSILSHPDHTQAPKELELSRNVVEFLITHATDLLHRVEQLAIDEHERVSAAGEGPRRTTPADTDSSVVASSLPVPVSNQGGQAVPQLLVTPNEPGVPQNHRRHHSKSLSSAQPPQLAQVPVGTPDSSNLGFGMFTALRRQVSSSRRRSDRNPYIASNDSTSSLGTGSIRSTEDRHKTSSRGTSPVRSDHDSMKSRLRRSIFPFRHPTGDEYGTDHSDRGH